MSQKRILIVDDDQGIRQILKKSLESQGYEVLTASDGQEGLKSARQNHPHLLILDLMLPLLDGYKVCRMLKFDRKFKEIPIIMLTSCSEQADEKLGYEVGADAYMTKPFNSKDVIEKIRTLLKEQL